MNEGRPHVGDEILNNRIQLVINTPLGRESFFNDRTVRRIAMMHGVPCITTLTRRLVAARRSLSIRPSHRDPAAPWTTPSVRCLLPAHLEPTACRKWWRVSSSLHVTGMRAPAALLASLSPAVTGSRGDRPADLGAAAAAAWSLLRHHGAAPRGRLFFLFHAHRGRRDADIWVVKSVAGREIYRREIRCPQPLKFSPVNKGRVGTNSGRPSVFLVLLFSRHSASVST